MKNIFAFSPVVKTLILGIGLIILGSCSSAKYPEFSDNALVPQFSEHSYHKAERVNYLPKTQDFFKEDDLKERNLKGKVKIAMRYTRYLDEKGKHSKENSFSPYSDYQILFDRMGNCVEYIDMTKGRAFGHFYYTYNPKEKTVVRIRPGTDSDKIWLYNDYYDDSGLKYKAVIKERNENAEPFSLNEFHYDENNSLILQETIRRGEVISTRTFKYDDSGNEIGYTQWDSDGKESWKVNKEYNEQGEIIRESQVGIRPPYNFTMEYEAYDDQGNWTQRRVYSDGIPIYFSTRVIEYYK